MKQNSKKRKSLKIHSRIVRKRDGTSVSRSAGRPSLRTLRARVAKDPGDHEARTVLAEILLERHKADEVIALLEAPELPVGGEHPYSLGATSVLAFAYTEAERFDDARELAEEALAAHPNALDYHYMLAYIGTRIEDYDLTLTHGQGFLSLATAPPDDPETQVLCTTAAQIAEVHNYIGYAREKQGDADAALASYENAIMARRTFDLPWANLVRLLGQVGRNDDAGQVLREARKSCPQSPLFRVRESMRRSSADKTTKAPAKTGKPAIALCMIVKNEEEHLPNCLSSVKSLVDEMIVVDTGSTDRTVEIAESFGAAVYHHEWEGSFSKARNISMGYANSDWILILDADEELQPGDEKVIREILGKTDFKAMAVSVYNYSAQKRMYTSFLPSIRLFRRDLGAYYEGIVHNQLRFPTLEGVLRAPVRINHYGYGLAPEIMKRKIARTKALLEEQLNLNPDHGFAHFNMAQLLRGEDRVPTPESMDRVIFHAGRAVDLSSPDDPQERHIHLMALHQLVTAYFNKNDYERAAEAAHRALAHKPGYLDAILSLGHIHSMDGRHDLARKYYLEYLDRQKSYDEHSEVDHVILLHLRSRHNALYGLGLVAEMQNDPTDSALWFERCIKEREDYIDAHHRLGGVYRKLGRAEDARREFKRELELHPKNTDASLEFADLLVELGEKATATRVLNAAAEHDPGSGRVHLRLGQISFGQKRYNDVLARTDAVETGDTEYPNILRLRADALFELGRYDEAAECYQRYLHTAPDDADALNNLGNCHFRRGDFGAAEEVYRSIIDSGKADSHVYRNLGVSLARLDRIDDAVFAMESYIELNPDDIESIGFLGDLHYTRGEFAKAIDQYERVVERQPNRPDTLTRLGDCYLNRGAVAAAMLGYERALVADPDYVPAWKRVREVRTYLMERLQTGAVDDSGKSILLPDEVEHMEVPEA